MPKENHHLIIFAQRCQSLGNKERLFGFVDLLAGGAVGVDRDHPKSGGGLIHIRFHVDFQTNIAGLGPWNLVQQGLAMVPEGRGVFTRMTILENLQMGAYLRDDNAAIADDMDRVFTTFPRLKERRDQLAGTLSGGEQQMLAMGRALMSRPQMLLLDEPSMGLSPIMVDKIFEVIREVSAQGVTILLVEQNASRALQIADRGYVMESGVITLSGPAQDLLHDPKVRAAYLGA